MLRLIRFHLGTPLPSAFSSSLKRRLLSGGAWAFSGQVLTAILAIGVNALLARLLTPKALGAYFLTLSLVSVAAMLGQMGLNRTVVRLVAESLGTGRPERARAAVRTVFRFGALGALVVAGILTLGLGRWLARYVFDSLLMAGTIGLATVLVVIVTFQGLLAETFRGFHDIRLATIFGGLTKRMLSIILFASLWVLHGHANLRQALTLSILAAGTSVLMGGFLLHKKVVGLESHEQVRGREVLAVAWPLLVTNLAVFALRQSNIWILGAFRPEEEVAIYGAAMRLVLLVAMPLSIVNSVIPPLIAEMYAQGKKRNLERMLRVTATLGGIPAFIALLGFILLGAPIMELVFGAYYRQGAMVLALLSLGQLVNVWAGSCGVTLVMTGHQNTVMRITIFAGFLTAVSALWLVKDYGAAGVAGVSASTLALQNILMLLYAKKKTGVWAHARFALLSKRQILVIFRTNYGG